MQYNKAYGFFFPLSGFFFFSLAQDRRTGQDRTGQHRTGQDRTRTRSRTRTRTLVLVLVLILGRTERDRTA